MSLWIRYGRGLMVFGLTVAVVVTSGCAGMQQTMARAGDMVRTHGGALVGAAAGATAGALICDDDDRIKCALAGGAAGVTLGVLWDKRRARLRRIAQQQNIPITTSKIKTFNASRDNGLAVAVNDGGMFASGSAQLKPAAARKMRALAQAYRDDPQSLLVVGHTDSTGGDRLNLKLSQQRAYTVASLLAEQGIDRSRVYFQGVGESQPIADNDTSAGRLANRRVEIVETDSARSIAAYSLQRESDPAFLAYSNKTPEEKKPATVHAASSSSSSSSQANTVATRESKPNSESQASSTVATNQPEAKPASEPGGSSIEPSRETQNTASDVAVDFGGRPASSTIQRIVAAAGPQTADDNGWSPIGTARAAEAASISPCYMNRPRRTAAVRNLASGQTLDPATIAESSYWPGLNGNIWLTSVNDNLVAYKNLRVMAGSGTVAGQPEVLVYRDYHGQKQQPDYRMAAHTRSYKGEDGVMIRSYFDDDAPMQCMDIVMANTSQHTAKAGILYYDHGRQLYENDLQLHRINAGG